MKEPVYIHREVMNKDEIKEHFRVEGVEDLYEKMHITVAYSKEPVEIADLELDLEEVILEEDLERTMELFGEANVMLVSDDYLANRHSYYRLQGCSYDFPSYSPHITLNYNVEDAVLDLKGIAPYTGKIVLGPEIAAAIEEDEED